MWTNPQETADLVTFTEEIFNGKFNFLCSGKCDRDNEFDLEIIPWFIHFIATNSGTFP